jgi:NAD+ kinase
MLKAEATEIGEPNLGFPATEVFSNSDMVIAMGGDGTILRIARILQSQPLPVFGINLGKIGFLMSFSQEEMFKALERTVSGNFQVEFRSMLEVKAYFRDRNFKEQLVLNDVLVTGQEFNRLAELDVFINGDLFSKFAADGLIISSPTGSTAYSLSAGGPFVSPNTEVILFTPICPHSLFNRSIVLASTDKLKIKAALGDMRVSLDGISFSSEVSYLEVKLAKHRFQIITDGKGGFFANLRNRLYNWDYFTRRD